MKQISICLIGNLLGRNPGYLTTQGDILANLLSKDGYSVISGSSKINRLLRLMDIVFTIVRNRKKIDVLILEVYSGLNILMSETTSFLGRVLGIPMIFVLHGGNLPEFAKKHPRWTKRVLARADMLLAPSSFLVNGLKPLGFPIGVVPNIIEIDKYPCRIRRTIKPKLIWMRSFHPLYNPQMAIRVLQVVRSSNPEATLVMAGLDKGLENETKTMAAELGLQNAIRFPGFLDHEAKIREFAEADIYLNTNRIDNTPVAVIEACAMGLPVIATDVGGLSDLIDDRTNGILVADEDVDNMAKAVNSLLNDAELTEKLSTNGRALAEKSSWSSIRTCWDEFFDEILKTKSEEQQSNYLLSPTSSE